MTARISSRPCPSRCGRLRRVRTAPGSTGATAVTSTGLTKRFRGGQLAVDRHRPARPARRGLRLPRAERLGQDHHDPDAARPGPPDRRQPHAARRPMPAGPRRVLPRVGALVEGPAFHPYLSGRDNLRRLDAADRTADPATARRRIAAALDRVGLTAAANKRYRTYSLGMRQRLGIAAALLQPARAARSSTSRPTASTRRAPARCARWSASSPPTASPCCSPPTCCPRSSRSARTSASCTSASWSPRARSTELRRSQQPRVAVETDRAGARPSARSAGLGLTAGADRGPARHRRARRGGAGEGLAALVHAGVPVRRSTVDAAGPRGRVRDADRGGLRCQRLRCRRSPAAPAVAAARGQHRGSCGRSCGMIFRRRRNIGDPGRAGRGPDHHRDRGQGDQRRRATAPTGRRSSARSPATGCSSALTALTVELPLFLPLAVAVDRRRRDRRRGEPRHAALPAGRPGAADPAAGGQVRRRAGLLPRRGARRRGRRRGDGRAAVRVGPVTLLSGTQVSSGAGLAAAAGRVYIAV